MKPHIQRLSAALLLSMIVPLLAHTAQPTTAPATTQPAISIETHFSPEEEIAPTIVKLIDGCQHTLDIAAFAFTHPDIANAIIRAHQRGVAVRMVMDLKNATARDSRIPDLIKAGIEVRIRHKVGDQHSKYLVIDQSIVVTGSFNFTVRADERNSENLLVIRNAPNVVKAFLYDFQILNEDSR
jgi:phosphatidylserine/phosphatidylglycerophosphate/cardiolipin synthase-like enzyme